MYLIISRRNKGYCPGGVALINLFPMINYSCAYT